MSPGGSSREQQLPNSSTNNSPPVNGGTYGPASGVGTMLSQREIQLSILQRHVAEAEAAESALSITSEGLGARTTGIRSAIATNGPPAMPSGSQFIGGPVGSTHVMQNASYSVAPQVNVPQYEALVRATMPTAGGVPRGWTSIHDRFIAYLATHAPLSANGQIPVNEELQDRYTTAQIVNLVVERFPQFSHFAVRASVIENRLVLLDEASDNDYFMVPYSHYADEDWGYGI